MKERKIAIPVATGNMCAHFGHCEQFAIFETNGEKIISSKFLNPPTHQPGVYPMWLKEQGVNDVIAGGMGQRAINLFLENKINVYVGAPLKEPELLVADLLKDQLEAGKNLCDH